MRKGLWVPGPDASRAEIEDTVRVIGRVHVVLRGSDHEIKLDDWYTNLVTLIGNQLIGERAFGITSPPAQITGMKLGTGTTAVAATGAGAALVTYKSGTNAAISGGFPTSATPSGGIRRITFQAAWAAGIGTDSALAEAVLVNETIATDATSLAAATAARVLLSPTINKAAGDSLTLTWQIDIGS